MFQGYPNYYPQGYQYVSTPQQRLAQMEQQYPQFAPQTPAQNVQWIQVSGLQGAREHIVQPNTTAWLMDNNDPVFYVKSSDNLGVTSLKAYRFEEIPLGAPAESTQIDPAKYVSREEFEQFKAQIAGKELNNG